MSEIELTALRGSDLLGFLAALGVLRLCTEELALAETALGWPDGPDSPARLSLPAADAPATVEQLAERVREIASACHEREQLFPEVEGLPPRLEDTKTDPMSRLRMVDSIGYATTARLNADRALANWLRATVGAVEMDGVLPRSQFFRAGPGTVWIERTMGKALEYARQDGVIEHGLRAWRRAQMIGAYLDHRADASAARGTPANGEPGATWLALMGMPLLPVRTLGPDQCETVGWTTPGRGARKGFHWPVWSEPMTVHGVRALLDHPDVEAIARRSPRARPLSSLSISAVFRSERLPAGNYSGAMSAPTRVWPS